MRALSVQVLPKGTVSFFDTVVSRARARVQVVHKPPRRNDSRDRRGRGGAGGGGKPGTLELTATTEVLREVAARQAAQGQKKAKRNQSKTPGKASTNDNVGTDGAEANADGTAGDKGPHSKDVGDEREPTVQVQFSERDVVTRAPLRTGDTVEVDVVRSKRTGQLEAVDIVLVIMAETDAVTGRAREQGVIATFRGDFGFIRCCEREEDLYFRFDDVVDLELSEVGGPQIEVGSEVAFDVIEAPGASSSASQQAAQPVDDRFGREHGGSNNERWRGAASANTYSAPAPEKRGSATRIVVLPKGTVSFETTLHTEQQGAVIVPLPRRKGIDPRDNSIGTVSWVDPGSKKRRATEIAFSASDLCEGTLSPRGRDKMQFDVVLDKRTKSKRAARVSLLEAVAADDPDLREQGVVTLVKDHFGFIQCATRDLRIFFAFREVRQQQQLQAQEQGGGELSAASSQPPVPPPHETIRAKPGDEVEFEVTYCMDRGRRKKTAVDVTVLPKGTVQMEDKLPERVVGVVVRSIRAPRAHTGRGFGRGRDRDRNHDNDRLLVGKLEAFVDDDAGTEHVGAGAETAGAEAEPEADAEGDEGEEAGDDGDGDDDPWAASGTADAAGLAAATQVLTFSAADVDAGTSGDSVSTALALREGDEVKFTVAVLKANRRRRRAVNVSLHRAAATAALKGVVSAVQPEKGTGVLTLATKKKKKDTDEAAAKRSATLAALDAADESRGDGDDANAGAAQGADSRPISFRLADVQGGSAVEVGDEVSFSLIAGSGANKALNVTPLQVCCASATSTFLFMLRAANLAC